MRDAGIPRNDGIEWLETDGPYADIVLSTRIRLARNLRDYRFGLRAEAVDRQEILARVRWSGAVPVLPWGFGKWWFYRGALIEALLRRPEPKWLFLGDNGGRPEFGGSPRLLREAGKRGVSVLPGSDPLPLPEHASRAGSCGFLMRNGVEERQPAAALRRCCCLRHRSR